MTKKTAVIVLWVVSLLVAVSWVRAQDLPATHVIYLGSQDVAVVVNPSPNRDGALTGRLVIKRDGKLLPVILEGR